MRQYRHARMKQPLTSPFDRVGSIPNARRQISAKFEGRVLVAAYVAHQGRSGI
jgi:hypothetical protein